MFGGGMGGGMGGGGWGGGGWGGGGILGGLFNSGGGFQRGGYPGGMYNGGQYGQYAPQPMGPGYGQYYQNAAPAQQPVVTQTRVYEPDTHRVKIQETGQYTGEYYNPLTQSYYVPSAETTTARATTSAQPGAKSVEPSKPAGPPRNWVEARLKAAPENSRKQIRTLIQKAYQSFVADELEESLRPFLFSDADRERLLGLAESKSSLTVDQMEVLRNLVDQVDEASIRLKLDGWQVGRDQYAGIPERIGLRKVLNDLDDLDFQGPPNKKKTMISRLFGAATKAGVPRDQIRSLTKRLDDFWQLSEDLENADSVGDGVDLASITPETVFKVVRLHGVTSKFPVMLASGSILLPLSIKPPGDVKLIFETATAVEVLPICGSASQPVPDAGADAPAAPLGVTLRVDPQAGADAFISVTTDETDTQSVAHTIKPGTSMPFPNRKTIQMNFSDGRGGWGQWEKVSAGSYLLSVQGGSWQRTVEPSTFVIDNTANCYPFNFRIGGMDGTVPARQTLSINRPTPSAAIEFNRGVGDTVAVKALPGKDGRFAVRLATAGGLELFDAGGALNNVESALADARPAPRFSGPEAIPAGPTPIIPSDGALEKIRPRFPVGTLDE
jgi:hypothetical protein